MARTPKPSGQPKRKSERRKTLPVFAVFTEGDVTERDYFRPLFGRLKSRMEAEASIQGCSSSPSVLVEKAIRYMKDRNDRGAFDFQVWCIFDVEAPQAHADLEEAISKAEQNGIKLAISNPCFELWLILHHQDQEAYISTDDAVTLRRIFDGSKGKEVDSTLYENMLSEAIARAERLKSIHENDGRKVPDNNPSSDVYLLFQAMAVDSL